jgi:hypothetical protein
MAGFRMHVGTSTVLGCGYAGALNLVYGVEPDTAIVSGAMCGFAGMLPDLDSDYGVPLRETMAFAAAIIPMFLIGHFQTMLLTRDSMVLVAVGIYLFVRFGVTKIIRKYTVHRGMFHSIPAMLIFTGLAFLLTGASPIEVRCYKAGGVLGGFLSHLLLDEIYALEWKGGRWRLKKSFGTAFKLWGDDAWSNFSTYAKLAIVVMLILGEPSVMQQIEARNPQIAGRINGFRDRIESLESGTLSQGGSDAARAAVNFFNRVIPHGDPNTAPQPQYAGPPANAPNQWQWPTTPQQPTYGDTGPPAAYQNGYDTAQRPHGPYPQ